MQVDDRGADDEDLPGVDPHPDGRRPSPTAPATSNRLPGKRSPARGGNRLKAAGIVLLVVLTAAGGCGLPVALRGGRARAEKIAADNGWQRMTFDAPPFVLTGYAHAGPGRELVVYLEGDGRAFHNRRTPASDPTPRDPLALRLAVLDPAPKVLYLARPCQYPRPQEVDRCHPRYWTVARYCEVVLAATGAALDQARRRLKAETLHLVGYSGGGGLALLMAARRRDVATVMTVAGNLDHAAWTRHHRVSPLVESFNPLQAASSLGHLPQVHLVGAKDRIVPPKIAESFMARLPPGSPATLVAIPDFSHRCCWSDQWPLLLARYRPRPESRP